MITQSTTKDKKQISFKNIKEQVSLWDNAFDESYKRSIEDVEFALCAKQWNEANVAERKIDNKHCLQFTVVNKVLTMARARAKAIELTLSVNAINNDLTREETQIMNMILDDMVLEKSHKDAFEENTDNTYTRGYSFYLADVVKESDRTLSNKVKIITIDDDRTYAYFDPKSPSRTLHDGEFCGLRYNVKSTTVRKHYPKVQLATNSSSVTIYDHFYKRYEKKKYIKLNTGEFVREDLADKANYATPYSEKSNYTAVIYHTRYIDAGREGILLDKAKVYPADDLPMAYNYGMSFRHKGKIQAMPLIHPLKDPQMLLNYIGSQIAEQVKSTSADKYFSTTDFVDNNNQEMKNNADNINKKSGLMLFNHLNYKVEPGQQLNPSLLEAYTMFEKVIVNLAGSLLESDASELNNLSGVAVDKMREPQDLLQNNMIKASIVTFNVIANTVQSMIPRIYTEQRTLTLKTDDGETEMVTINQPLVTDPKKLKNNIRDLTANYYFEIRGDVSSRLKQQNTVNQLNQVYQIDPTLIPKTGDIYMENLDSPYADELKRAAQADMTPQFLDYRSGKLTLEEYQQFVQQQQANQPPPPQLQLAQGKLQVEQGKLTNEQQKNQLKAQELQQKSQQENIKSTIDTARLATETRIEAEKHEHNKSKDMLDALINLLNMVRNG
jgi:hypothetical protein